MENSTKFTQNDVERLKKLCDERSELRREGLLKRPKPALKTENEHFGEEDLVRQPKSSLKREQEHAITKAGELSLDPLATPCLAAEVKQEPENPEKS